MDLRRYPRTRLCMPVGLHCATLGGLQQRRISDISTGGLFVGGSPRAKPGVELDILMPSENELRLRAEVARVAANGFGVQFTNLGDFEKIQLEAIIEPSWDGENMNEGMMICAAREVVDDLAGWLRLTALVTNQFRQRASGSDFARRRKTPGEK